MPQPWNHHSPGMPASLAIMHEQAAALRPISPPSQSPGQQATAVKVVPPKTAIAKKSAIAKRSSVPALVSAKAGVPERQYSEEEYRGMLDLVIQGCKSARAAAIDAEFPSAERTLQRHAAAIRAMPQLVHSTEAATIAAQRAHVASASLAIKGNPDLVSRRIFTEDELHYFARSLKLYADMGWHMDHQAIQLMFSQSAREKKRVDWRQGDPYVVSKTYVADFLKDERYGLRNYKAGHIDPLRSKKATTQVCMCLAACDVSCVSCEMHTLLKRLFPKPFSPLAQMRSLSCERISGKKY